ncbi:4-coumarate--CoA ligase [Rubrimonas cliftonensis]|uniref:4-coumarate--CoA ligase n=1 Tax=Rubrimonas cliftonensis TaxID=89524 RepID=A0A1H4ANH1_9RHOB|nr:4-coumarate--CoA ligase [Rubrimonas cliftonensis]SEA37224.1 4-coumarate--CoA ligase, photoactive yellow protein activation family [Rubrimonas cliftonensis]
MTAQIDAPCADAPPAAPVAAGGAISSPLLARVIDALVAEEFGRIRGRTVGPAEWTRWTAATRLDEDAAGDAPCPALGADSLARLEIIARVNQFFHLHETGAEDYLVVRPTLGDWRDIVAASLRLRAERITFLTGGSTGAPKPITHALADLVEEARGHRAILGAAGGGRVIALAPPQHIYGFLWGGLAPDLRGVETLDGRAWGPARAASEAREGDVVIATPFLWDLMLRSGARFRPGVTGVTSTAPAPEALWTALAEAGLGRLVEIYGSSETGGLGWRDEAGAPFAPLPHLACDGAEIRRRRDGARLAPPDRIDWRGDGCFAPAGRLDGAVQVGGVNVSTERVRAHLLRHPGVADCAVRLGGAGAGARLKAFVVPASGAAAGSPVQSLVQSLEAHCAALPAPERPARFAFGPGLPLNAMGKPTDWN